MPSSPAKRRKLEKGRVDCGASTSGQSDVPWELLPDLAVIQVLGYLKKRDQESMALTCKRWERLFHSPCLWRDALLDFANKQVTKQDIIGFCRHARYIKHVRISGKRHEPFQNFLEPVLREKPSVKCLPKFLKTYLTYSKGLHCFSLNDVNVSRNFKSARPIVDGVTKVLSKQDKLDTVQLSTMRLPKKDGLKVMWALGKNSGHCLTRLNIMNLFNFYVSAADQEFFMILGLFKNLRELYLNYNCLSDGAVLALARNTSATLQLLSVDVYEEEPYDHVIQQASWRELKNASPNLKVTFDLDDIDDYHVITNVLSRGIPLHTLKIWTGYGIDDEARLPALFLFLVENFSDTLVDASLQLDNNLINIDEEFMFFIKHCKKLQSLEILADISVHAIDRICRLRGRRKIGLNRFHATLCNTSDEEAVDLMMVEDAHMAMIYRNGLDYDFQTDVFEDSSEDDDEV